MEKLITRMVVRKGSSRTTETDLENSQLYRAVESVADELMTDILQSKKKKTRLGLTLGKTKKTYKKENALALHTGKQPRAMFE